MAYYYLREEILMRITSVKSPLYLDKIRPFYLPLFLDVNIGQLAADLLEGRDQTTLRRSVVVF